MIKKIAFIGQPTLDMDRAKQFYGEVLGLEMDHDYGHGWCEFVTPDGKAIALDTFGPKMLGENARPYVSLEIEDLDAYVARLEEQNVEFLMPLTINRNDEEREICRMAVIRDSEGNAVMLHQKAAWRD